MLPSLQPSRPKVFTPHAHTAYHSLLILTQLPHQPTQPTYAHQQRRTTHELPQQQQQQQQPPHATPVNQKPRSQVEAMPPSRTSPFRPPQSFYDAATRHPVFFTNNLRKPPFPIPQTPSQGWNPVAIGYIQERERVTGGAGTKL